MSKQKLIFVVVILVVLGIGGYYWPSQKQLQKYTGPVEKITIAVNYKDLSSSLILVAREEEYFARNGLNVTINYFDSGIAATKALLAENADIAAASEMNVVTAGFDQNNIKIFTSIATSQSLELIARKDRGVVNLADLKGKKIGIPGNTTVEYFMSRFLLNNRLSPKDVIVLDMQVERMEEAIVSGEVDAVAVWDSSMYTIKNRLGENGITWSIQSGGQDGYWLLISTQAFIQKWPHVFEKLLKAMVEAEEFVKKNPERVKEIVRREMGVEQSYIETFWPTRQHGVSLEQSMLILMEDEARWRIEKKLTDKTKVPNYLDYIYFDALEAVKPEAVTIIH